MELLKPRFATRPRVLLPLIALLLNAPQLHALQVPPAPSSWVNDYAGLLPAEERESLAARLAAVEKASGVQIVFAIFPSLEGESLEDFSMRLAEQWKLGKKGKDNGVLLTLFMKERRVRIEVGYGLEDKIPDAMAGRIIREMAGYFRQNDYSGGLNHAADRLFALAGGGSLPVPEPSRREPIRLPWFLTILIVLFLLRAVIPRKPSTGFRIDARGRRRNTIPWWLPLIVGSSTRKRHGGWSSGSWSGSGHNWGGSGGGFGGSSGGSFSGGGGGSFGGGGSSGSW